MDERIDGSTDFLTGMIVTTTLHDSLAAWSGLLYL